MTIENGLKNLLLIVAVILCHLITGCASAERDEKMRANVFTELPNSYDDYILVDKETGVQYIFIRGYNKLALTVRLDADGKPMVDGGGE